MEANIPLSHSSIGGAFDIPWGLGKRMATKINIIPIGYRIFKTFN
jgi:hypothetical protein